MAELSELKIITPPPQFTLERSEAHLERDVIAWMVTNDNFCRQALKLEPEKCLHATFSCEVVRWIRPYFAEYGRAPGKDIQRIFDRKVSEGLEPDLAGLVNQFLTSLAGEWESTGFSKESAREHLLKRYRQHGLEQAGRLLEKNNIKSYQAEMARLQAVSFGEEPPGSGYVYICGNPETFGAVRGLIDEELIKPGEVLQGIPALGQLAGKDVVVVNCDGDTLEKLRTPANLGSLRAVDIPLNDLEGDYRDYVLTAFTQNPDLARRDLKRALPEYIMSGHEFIECDFPEISRLCGPIETQSINLFFSPPGVGKTFLAMEIAAALTGGRPAMAGLWEVPRRANALFVDGEMLPKMIQERISMLRLGNCQVVSKAGLEADNVVPTLNLAEGEVRDWVEDVIIKGRFELVVFDNLYSLITGLDSNSSRDWEPVNLWFLRLRAKGVSIILIHHSGKSGDQLGTASKLFNVNLALALQGVEDKEDESCSFTIKVVKQRSRGLGLTGKRYTCNNGKWTVTEDREELNIQCLRMLAAGSTYAEIAKEVGKSPGTITKIKNLLVKSGWLMEEEGTGRGRNAKLTLTDAGREKLSSLSGEGG